jgi:glycosyltransferase involved in cell wall biosynthesis
VIVPARNAAATIGDTLAGLARQSPDPGFEVIVVDDGSDDETAAIAAAAGATVLREDRRGPGPARNRGAAAASAPALAFLDADCAPHPDWLGEGLRALERADLVQGRVEAADPDRLGPFDHTIWVLGASPLFESANLFVRRELFERLGGFEDWLGARIGKPLAEDVWFGWRARRTGATTAFADRARVEHAVIARGPRAFVAERVRLAYFPAMVRQVPELRREFLYAGVFLTRRTALFDLGLAGAVAAAATRSAIPLAACLPYGWAVGRRAARHRRNAPLVAAAELAADALGFGALVAGCLRWRRVVL